MESTYVSQLQALVTKYTFGKNKPHMILIHFADLNHVRVEMGLDNDKPGIELIACLGVPLVESDLAKMGYPMAVVR